MSNGSCCLPQSFHHQTLPPIHLFSTLQRRHRLQPAALRLSARLEHQNIDPHLILSVGDRWINIICQRKTRTDEKLGETCGWFRSHFSL